MNKTNFNKNTQLFSFITILLITCLIPGPQILGSWESFNYYFMFESIQRNISFVVSNSADIGDPTYGFVGISRLILDLFELQPTLTLIRAPSVFYGFMTLITFYYILIQIIDNEIAKISTILLAINPIFHFYTHSMNVLMISGFAFLLVIAALQRIQINSYRPFNWCVLGFALALVSMHYGAGRIFILIYLIVWIPLNLKSNIQFNIKNIFFTITFYLLVLSIFNIKNLKVLINPISHFIPQGNEIAMLSNFSKLTTLGLLDGILINLKITADLILNKNYIYHVNNPYLLTADFRYEIINSLFILIPVIIGLFYYSKKVFQSNIDISEGSIKLLTLFLICFLSPLFSLVFIDSNTLSGIQSSLSNYRLFYLLFPCYLFLAQGIYFINSKYKYTIFFLYIFSIYGLYNLYQINVWNIENLQIQNYEELKQIDRPYEFYDHIIQHSEYYEVARKIQAITNSSSLNDTFVIKLNQSLLKNSKNKPSALPYLEGLNYHSSFISLYLNTMNIKNAYLPNISKSSLGLPYQYSRSLYTCENNSRINLERDIKLLSKKFNICKDDKCKRIIFTFCPDEIIHITNWLNNKNIIYKVVNVD